MSPALIFYLVDKAGRTPKAPAARIPYEILVFIIALMGSLPASIAMFPQNGKLARGDLEAEVRESLPQGITTVYYNKGLWGATQQLNSQSPTADVSKHIDFYIKLKYILLKL